MEIPRVSQNAYRLLGLPGHATLDQIQKGDGALRRALKLNAAKQTDWDTPWIGALARSEAAVREALGRLTSTPSNRLKERLFWFDGDTSLHSISKSSLDNFIKGLPYSGTTKISHDLALLHLMASILQDPDFNDSQRWSKTFQAWKDCIADEEYWASVLETEMTGGFEPAATSEEVEHLRQEALSVVADVIASMARDAMARGHQDRFRRAANVLEASGISSGLLSKFENETFGSREDSFTAACSAIRNECGGKIQRDGSGVEENKVACAAALARFTSEIETELFKLTAFAGANSDITRRAREAAASLLTSIAIDNTWTNDFVECEKILKRAKELAPSDSITIEKIEEVLFDVAKSAQKQRYPKGSTSQDNSPEGRFEGLCLQTSTNCRDNIRRDEQSVSANRKVCQKALERFDTELKPELDKLLVTVGADSTPGLMAREAAAMCLHSIAIDLTWANEFKIGEATLGEALALVPSKSTAARRIEDSLEKFPRSKSAKGARPAPKPAPAPKPSGPLGPQAKPAARKRDWEKLDPISSAPSLGTLNGFGFRLYGQTDLEPVNGQMSYLTTYYFTALYVPIIPICRYRVINAGGNRYQFLLKAPLRMFDKVHLGIAVAAIVGFFIMVNQDSGHTTYTPPTSYSSSQQDKGSLVTQIKTNSARIKELEGQLKELDLELAAFKTAITPLRKEIKGYESDIKNDIRFDHDAYELALKNHNEIADQARPVVLKREKAYKEYDQLIKTTNGLLHEYKK